MPYASHSLRTGGIHTSGAARDISPEPVCCSRCRRGTREQGVFPCGYDMRCPAGCHDRSSK